MTWIELKEFCNSLPEDQLKRSVILWREEDAITDIWAEQLLEDHYKGDEDDGCYPLSDAGLTIEDAEEQGLEKVYSVGDAILWEKF